MGHCRKKVCTVVLTNRCNLNCSYCWVSDRDDSFIPKTIDINFAKRGIYDYYHSTGEKYIGFFASGEPTIELNLMRELVSYAKEIMGDGVKVELQTNGVFSDKAFNWIKDNVDILWFSMDGPIQINDINRKFISGLGSGKFIENNIRRMFEYKNKHNKDMIIGARGTIGRFNVYKQKEMIDYFDSLGIKGIYVEQICAKISEDAENNFIIGDLDSEVFAEEFYKAYEYARGKGIFYGTMATMNFDEEVEIACRSLIPMPHLTPDGFVSGCEMCYEEGSPLDVFIYGKWNSGKNIIEYDKNKIEKIKSRNIYNLEGCSECKFLKNCAGSCAGETVNEVGDLYGRNDRLCKIIKYLGERIERNTKIYPYLHP